jgi:hypothetical protein
MVQLLERPSVIETPRRGSPCIITAVFATSGSRSIEIFENDQGFRLVQY